MFKKLCKFNVVIMADIFAKDVCKSAFVSFSTTICPHGWNNFAAVEWIFITTNYLWLKSDNNILCMTAYMCFACILNVTHFFCRPRNVSNRSLRRRM
jgi:hypothetical protein